MQTDYHNLLGRLPQDGAPECGAGEGLAETVHVDSIQQ